MTKILYFTAEQIQEQSLNGVGKKVIAQCDAFAKYFEAKNVYLSFFSSNSYYVKNISNENSSRIDFSSEQSRFRKLQLKKIYPWLEEYILANNIDSLYFRCPGLDYYSYKFFKNITKMNVKIIIEIPTWPFWREKRQEILETSKTNILKSLLKTISLIDYWRETYRLKQFVECIVTYSTISELWGLPVIGISNGYDFDKAPTISFQNHYGINLVIAANLRENHGVDRMITSLSNYHGSIPVTLHIAGEGEASENLRVLASNLGVINRSVFFYGYLFGDELLSLYSKCDAGVSALGFHRYGVKECSPLKTKEYFAFGLPCIGTIAERDILRSSVSRYYFAVSDDESLIDMQGIVDFLLALREDKVTSEMIKTEAKRVFDWKEIMRPVLERF